MRLKHLLTIFIIGDGDGNNVASAHHGTTPVVTQWRPKMHLELLFRLKNGVIIDVNCAVFDLRSKHKTFDWAGKCLNRHTHTKKDFELYCTFSPLRKVMRDSSAFLLSSKSSITMADMVRVKQRTDDLKDRSPVRMMGMWRTLSFSFTV